MKRTLTKIMALLLTVAAVLVAVGLFRTVSVSAAPSGKLNIEFISWDEIKPTDEFRVHLWDGFNTTTGAKIEADNDNKHLLKIETDMPESNNDPKLIVVKNKEGQTFSASQTNLITEWDKAEKLTGDVALDKEAVKTWTDGKTIRIYQGAGDQDKVNDSLPVKTYYEIAKDKANVFVAFTSTNAISETMSLHVWGSDTDTQWGKTADLFRTSGKVNGYPVLIAHLTTNDAQGLGVILMDKPGDSGKLTGDIKYTDENAKVLPFLPKGADGLGKSITYLTYSKGKNTAIDNVFAIADSQKWQDSIFAFSFIPEIISATGLKGTTAKDKVTVFAETVNPVKFNEHPGITGQELEDKNKEDLLSWIKIQNVTDPNTPVDVKIKSIDTNYKGVGTSSFVINLAEELDNTKQYKLLIDNGQTDKDKMQKADIVLNLDSEAPQLIFPDFINDPTKMEVEVEYNKQFPISKIPVYQASDNRDGDLTETVYIPGEDEKNDKRFVDPGKKGNYEVLFKVTDAWGNVTEQIVTFVVK